MRCRTHTLKTAILALQAAATAIALLFAGCAGRVPAITHAPARTLSPARALAATATPNGLPLFQPVAFKELADAITANLSRVEEFRIIQETARELGLRVWLFGGTAAGYAHYVKWDLLRLAGDTRYVAARFDYDFTSIYRSTQDADLVVDGTVADATRLETLIKTKFSYLQGSKSEWEVRLLRSDRGTKQALLNNPDFLNQHTDSNSTGMIELTEPPAGEAAVRDLRDWENLREPQFLKDVAEGKLHYYFNPLHKTTSRYLAGENPEIFSVIRYFTKAFQYELELRKEDLAHLRKIIARFNPATEPARWSEWARGWIDARGNGAKLIKHAVNIEYAWNVLKEIGLRQKLLLMSNPENAGTMGWWLNREPLRTKPVGSGNGRTAREVAAALGIPWEEFVVAHETRDFLAYESLTRETTGRPNVLISRSGYNGESAMYGDGHYTRVGRVGATGSGLTVRYRVDPNAREGWDFLTAEKDYLIFLNRAALRVIPESLNIGPMEYFQMLLFGTQFDASDRGVLEKLKRKISNRLARATDEELRGIAELLIAGIREAGQQPKATNAKDAVAAAAKTAALNSAALQWFGIPRSVQYPEVFEALLDARLGLAAANYGEFVVKIMQFNLGKVPGWKNAVERLSQSGLVWTEQILELLKQPQWRDDKPWREHILDLLVYSDRKTPGALHDLVVLAKEVLGQPEWGHRPDWVLNVIARYSPDQYLLNLEDSARNLLAPPLIEKVLSQPHWDSHVAEFVAALRARDPQLPLHLLIKHVYSRPVTLQYPEWIEDLFGGVGIMHSGYLAPLCEHVLSQEWAKARPDWVERLINLNTWLADINLAKHVLGKPHWVGRKDWAKAVFKHAEKNPHYIPSDRTMLKGDFFEHVFSQPAWKDDPYLLAIIESEFSFQRGGAPELTERGKLLLRWVLRQPHWYRPDWIESLLSRNQYLLNRQLIEHVLSQPYATKHPEWIRPFVENRNYDELLWMHVFNQPHWADAPECEFWIDRILKRDAGVFYGYKQEIFYNPRWKNRVDWLLFFVEAGKTEVGRPSIDALLRMPHWKGHPKLRKLCKGREPTYDCLRGSPLNRCMNYLKNKLFK